MTQLMLAATAIRMLADRFSRDDRGEINSNVAWAGLMLVVAVSVGGIILAAAEGAAGRFNFGF